MTSLPTDRSEQKALGAWYTPTAPARLLVRWAIRATDATVLDPSVGDGQFLLEAAGRLRELGGREAGRRLIGVDLNRDAVRATARALGGVGVEGARLVTRDFFQIEPPARLLADLPEVDAVIGNPPYIRYQSFTGRARAVALARALEAGVRLTALSSSWAPFVVHAVSFLRDGGRLGFVLPEELLHTTYAEQVRDFLRRHFRRTSILRFDKYLFPNSQERVVLLFADGKGEEPRGELCLCSAETPDDVADLDNLQRDAETFAPAARPSKWQAKFDDAGTAVLDELVARGDFVELRSVGKASIGYVSGANDYFVLTESEIARRGFPSKALCWTVLAAKQVPGAVLGASDLRAMAARDERCRLWTGDLAEHHAVRSYINEGRERGITDRYKCRVRKPWYVVPGVCVPEAFLTYMSDVVPRLVLNAARATCSNNLHAVQLNAIPVRLKSRFVASFYNSITMLAAERVGRHYGGGVLKLEPSEADRVVVPSPALLGRTGGVRGLLARVDVLLRERDTASTLRTVDEAVLREGCRLSRAALGAVHESRLRRQEDRSAGRRARRGGIAALL